VSLTAGCMQWKAVDLDGPGIAPQDVTAEVRITRSDGDTITLRDAAIRADSITGLEDDGSAAAVALSDVHGLEARRVNPVVLLMPAIVIGFIVVPRVFNHTVRDQTPSSVVTDGP
jgi:hypothetical protein